MILTAMTLANEAFAEPWAQFGILGLVIVGILYTRVIVPGWAYVKLEARIKKLEDALIEAHSIERNLHREKEEALTFLRKEKDEEIARLRYLADTRVIPLLERSLFLIERTEEAWGDQSRSMSRPHS